MALHRFSDKKNALNKAYYGKAFSRFEYMGEVSVICHLPFGAISAYVNHYSSPRREWNVGMTSAGSCLIIALSNKFLQKVVYRLLIRKSTYLCTR